MTSDGSAAAARGLEEWSRRLSVPLDVLARALSNQGLAHLSRPDELDAQQSVNLRHGLQVRLLLDPQALGPVQHPPGDELIKAFIAAYARETGMSGSEIHRTVRMVDASTPPYPLEGKPSRWLIMQTLVRRMPDVTDQWVYLLLTLDQAPTWHFAHGRPSLAPLFQ